MTILRIERLTPRPGAPEEPIWTAKGYQQADPAHGPKRHHAAYAVHVRTLEEVAELLARGFALRMGAKGKRGSLIAAANLKVVRC